jgi:hypothetical protein
MRRLRISGDKARGLGTPTSWNFTRPITFSLVVDDFGIKYAGKEHADHLINCLKEKYKLTEDWVGNFVLRHIAPVGLCSANAQHCYAGVYKKTIIEIQAHHATSATLPVLTGAKKIRRRSTIPPATG